MFKELLGERIQFVESVESWQKAIELCAAPLQDQGYIHRSYVDAIIANIQEEGSYMFLCDGILLPHAQPEDGVQMPGMSFLLVKNGVVIPGAKKPGYAFFMMSITDQNSHLYALLTLAELLDVQANREKLFNIKTPEELYDFIPDHDIEDADFFLE